MDDLILNKVKAPNSLAKISVPKYLKGALVLNITFKKIYWDLTPDNIEKHRDDEAGGEYIDFYGVVVVRAIDDVGNFNKFAYKVIALESFKLFGLNVSPGLPTFVFRSLSLYQPSL